MAKRKTPRVRAKVKKQAVRKGPKLKPAASARAATKGKWVYAFGGGRAEGKPNMRNLLGGKGAGLAEMEMCIRDRLLVVRLQALEGAAVLRRLA